MAFISQTTGYLLLVLFGIVMVLITWFFGRWKRYRTIQGFLVAERNVNWWLGATSIAASWIWAPALFVSVQMAYEKGLPGIFWFTFPNIIALLIFIFLAPKIRKLLPTSYTLPQYIRQRLKSERVHKMYLFPYFFYQLMAVAVQLFAGGSLIYLLTGIHVVTAMSIISVIVLAYGLISGLESSMVTDFVQFLMIIIGVLIVVPWAVISAGGISAEMSTGMSAGGTAENMSTTAPEGITGSAITGLSVVNGVSVVNGLSAVSEGLGGASGRFRNIFDPGVAFSFGIVTAIGLISGAISDQQYWQRAFAIKKKNLVKSFVFGAVMFGIVPIIISSLGFLAANNSFANAVGITLPEGADASMIGVVAVSKLLPPVGAAIFVLMLLGALCSTMDSGLSATSSLYVIDVVRYKKEQTDVLKKFDEGKAHLLSDDERKEFKRVSRKGVWNSRISMIAITLLGFGVALAANYVPGFGLKHLWWIFNTVAACVVVPTLLSLYWKRLDAKGVFWGVLISFVVGVPLFVYGNIINNSLWIVGSSLFIIGISTLCCLIMPKARSKENIREQDSASS